MAVVRDPRPGSEVGRVSETNFGYCFATDMEMESDIKLELPTDVEVNIENCSFFTEPPSVKPSDSMLPAELNNVLTKQCVEKLNETKKDLKSNHLMESFVKITRADVKCDSCRAMNKLFQRKFQQMYCTSCFYTWQKYISKYILAECEEGCDRQSIAKCRGCRSVALNASVPPNRQIRLREKDSRRRYVEAAIALKEGRPVNAGNSTETSTPTLLTVSSSNSKLLPTKAITLSDEGLKKPINAKDDSLLVPTTKITALQSESVLTSKTLKESPLLERESPLLATKSANTRSPDGQTRMINLLSSPLKCRATSVVKSASVTKLSLARSKLLPKASSVKPKIVTSLISKRILLRNRDKPAQSLISKRTDTLRHQKPAHMVNNPFQPSQILVRSPQIVLEGRAIPHNSYTLEQLVSDGHGQGGIPGTSVHRASGNMALLTNNLNTPVKSKEGYSRHILQKGTKRKALAPTLAVSRAPKVTKSDLLDNKSLLHKEKNQTMLTDTDSVFTPLSESKYGHILSIKRTHDTVEDKDNNLAEKSKHRKISFNTSPFTPQTGKPIVKALSMKSSAGINNSNEGGSQRLRKPSQKLIEFIQNDLLSKNSMAFTRRKPDASTRCEPEPIEESPIGVKCDSCGITNKPFMEKFHRTYCHPCLDMWIKYLSRNVLPECEEGCDHNSIFECHGCRSVAFNASVSPDRRIRLRKKDSRRRYVEAAIALKEGRPVNAENSTEKNAPILLTVSASNSKLSPINDITLSDERLAKPFSDKASQLLVPKTNIAAQGSEHILTIERLAENPLLATEAANIRSQEGQVRTIKYRQRPEYRRRPNIFSHHQPSQDKSARAAVSNTALTPSQAEGQGRVIITSGGSPLIYQLPRSLLTSKQSQCYAKKTRIH